RARCLTFGEDPGHGVEPVARAHADNDIPGGEHEVRAGRDDRVAIAEHRDDRSGGTRSYLGVTERPPGVGRVGGQRDLFGQQTGGLLPEPGQLAHHQGRTEQFGEGRSFLVVQRKLRHARVGILNVVDHQIATTGSVRDHADTASLLGGEVITDADSRQRRLFDANLHARHPTEQLQLRRLLTRFAAATRVRHAGYVDNHGAIVLLHSPLTGATVWGRVPHELGALDYTVVVPEVTGDNRPPYATRYVAAAAKQTRARLAAL